MPQMHFELDKVKGWWVVFIAYNELFKGHLLSYIINLDAILESILPKEVKQPGIKQDFIGALQSKCRAWSLSNKIKILHNIKS